MVKFTSHMIKASKSICSKYLPVMLPANNFEYQVIFTEIACIINCFKFYRGRYSGLQRNACFLYLSSSEDHKLYKNADIGTVVSNKKHNTDSCKINNQSQSLAEAVRGYCSWLRYSFLKLARRSPTSKADSIANYRTSNTIRVGMSENNKEQCHRLWLCQTIVDS